MRWSLSFFFLCACTFNFGVEGEVVEKDGDSGSGDSGGGDTADSGDSGGGSSGGTEEMRRVLHVEFEGMPFAGYSVGAPANLIAVSSSAVDTVYGWSVDGSAYEEAFVPPDAADFTYMGAAGTYSGIGMLDVPAEGMMLEGYACFAGDYDGAYAANGGRLSCFAHSKVIAGAALVDANADLVVYSAVANTYLGQEALAADVDGDGASDLVAGGGSPGAIYVLSGIWQEVAAATVFPVVKVVPADADLTVIGCDTDGDGVSNSGAFCQPKAVGGGKLLVSDAGYDNPSGPMLEVWSLPLTPSSTADTWIRTAVGYGPIATAGVWTDFGWVVNDPTNDKFILYSSDLSASSNIQMPIGAEAWGLATATVGGDPWIAFGANRDEPEGTPIGSVFVANLASGMPGDWSDAAFAGSGTGNNRNCGWSVAFGKTLDDKDAIVLGCYDPDTGNNYRGAEVFTLEAAP